MLGYCRDDVMTEPMVKISHRVQNPEKYIPYIHWLIILHLDIEGSKASKAPCGTAVVHKRCTPLLSMALIPV